MSILSCQVSQICRFYNLIAHLPSFIKEYCKLLSSANKYHRFLSFIIEYCRKYLPSFINKYCKLAISRKQVSYRFLSFLVKYRIGYLPSFINEYCKLAFLLSFSSIVSNICLLSLTSIVSLLSSANKYHIDFFLSLQSIVQNICLLSLSSIIQISFFHYRVSYRFLSFIIEYRVEYLPSFIMEDYIDFFLSLSSIIQISFFHYQVKYRIFAFFH